MYNDILKPSKNFVSQDKGGRKAKPFLKWAGGKGQLLNEIAHYYPFEQNNIKKYAEPFVGGGAVLFDILNKYKLEEVYVSDINSELINTYCVIRDNVENLIAKLHLIEKQFLTLNQPDRKEFFIQKRNYFNEIKIGSSSQNIEKSALMIFLNKTCFNGLFRVNKKGIFNVPFGDYKSPLICDEDNLRIVSEKLQNVTIMCQDYKRSAEFIDDKTFVYFDPPYRPLNATSNFTGYTYASFNDTEQQNLANFVNNLHQKGAKIVISNSDPKNIDKKDNFFDKMYSAYSIKRVAANRMINSNRNSRGKIKELLISNFA
ncbi:MULTISPECIES: DNA adenine methylase [unclassified Desulfovibrio]|uniref:DNA adenine methylase n=1 Tax=unclassified Desulfovibrio TaxID=2593640 RepID=UPI0013EB38B5|nr:MULTISPECIES: DNA adenine methylase [unclassified Desulfovibrio]